MKNFFIIFIFLLSGCTERNVSILSVFNHIDVLQGEKLPANTFLGYPSQINTIDSFLLIIDQHDDFLMTVVNLSTGESKRTLRFGQGPNELIRPVSISQLINDSVINILERGTSTIVQFKIKDILSEKEPPIIKKTMLEGGAKVPQEAEEFYVALGFFDKMLSLYDKKGQKKHEYISYPKGASRFRDFERFIAYQSEMVLSPDGKKLVQAGYYFDLLCFYRIDKEHISEYKKYFTNDANIQFKNNRTELLPNTTLNFYSLYPTNDIVYALYDGNEYGNRKNNQNKSCYLLCFDWDGNPLKAYKFDRLLYSICVHKGGAELLGLSLDDGAEILKYNLLQKTK